MATGNTIEVRGLTELVRGFGKLDAELRRGVQREISDASEIVAAETRERASRYGKVGPIRARVRGARGFIRSNAKSKHVRPDFGELLIRTAFLPALAAKQEEVIARIDEMLGRLAGEAGF